MKRLILGIAIVCSTFFYGCKEKTPKKAEEEKVVTVDPAFVGIWKGQDYTTDVESATEQTVNAGKAVTKATSYKLNNDGSFVEKVLEFESKGTWEYNADSSTFFLKYAEKKGPNDRSETLYKVESINDSLLVLKFKLQNYGYEVYTFKKSNN